MPERIEHGVRGRIDNRVCPSYMSQARHIGYLHIRHIFYKDRNIIGIGDDDIPYFIDIIQQADPTYYISLVVPDNEIPADIDIAFLNGGIDIQGGNAEIGQFAGIYPYFIGLYPATETDDIRYAGYRPDLPVDHPVLHGLYLPGGPDIPLLGITKKFRHQPAL